MRRYAPLACIVRGHVEAAVANFLWQPDAQDTRRREGEHTLQWSIEPMVLQDRFSGSGTTRVVAKAGGCERIIAGDLTIRVPILGRKMEQRLISDVASGYDRAAVIIREMLRER
jgi:predicted enzyme involved in methoxymalonyl-ACP biosynthesis